jgi:hypothetical protein
LRRTKETKNLPFFVKNLPDFMQLMRPETHRQRQNLKQKEMTVIHFVQQSTDKKINSKNVRL